MGSLIGGVIGGIGSLVGGMGSKSGSGKAAAQDLTGYNYLTKGAGAPTITAAQNNGVAAGAAQAGTQGAEAQLLGTAPVTSQTKTGFSNYLDSTGYKFQVGQGTAAIAGNAATRGLLNSGGTAKALAGYGQGMAGQSFNNYLSNLSNLNTQQGATAGQGIQAAQAVGQAGTAGGAAAGAATQAGANANANGVSTAANQVGSAVADNFSTIKNFFG
jgi:hypothetical protein